MRTISTCGARRHYPPQPVPLLQSAASETTDLSPPRSSCCCPCPCPVLSYPVLWRGACSRPVLWPGAGGACSADGRVPRANVSGLRRSLRNYVRHAFKRKLDQVISSAVIVVYIKNNHTGLYLCLKKKSKQVIGIIYYGIMSYVHFK